jgi:superfamily I DNA/RNA helicase
LRVINTPSRKIGKTTIDRMVAHATSKATTLWKIISAGDLPSESEPQRASHSQIFMH